MPPYLYTINTLKEHSPPNLLFFNFMNPHKMLLEIQALLQIVEWVS